MASRGRPAFKPTEKQRREVRDLAQYGISHRNIARTQFIGVETLKKHFDDELIAGHARRKLEVITMLWESARAGKVSAMWAIWKIIRKADRAEKRARNRSVH